MIKYIIYMCVHEVWNWNIEPPISFTGQHVGSHLYLMNALFAILFSDSYCYIFDVIIWAFCKNSNIFVIILEFGLVVLFGWLDEKSAIVISHNLETYSAG